MTEKNNCRSYYINATVKVDFRAPVLSVVTLHAEPLNVVVQQNRVGRCDQRLSEETRARAVGS